LLLPSALVVLAVMAKPLPAAQHGPTRSRTRVRSSCNWICPCSFQSASSSTRPCCWNTWL